MSSTSQEVKSAASAEPPIIHENNPQMLKRAASPEPQSTNQSKRQKPLEQDDADGEVAAYDFSENNTEAQPEEAQPEDAQPEGAQPEDAQPEDAQSEEAQPGPSPGNETDRDGSGDPGEDSDDGNDPPRKKVDQRIEWDKALDIFVQLGNETGYFTDYLRSEGHDDCPSMSPNERHGLMEEVQKSIYTAEPSKTPSEETRSEETRSQETPSAETQSQETPSEKTSSEETPSEQAPSEETPFEENQPEFSSIEEDPIPSERCSAPEAAQTFVASSFAPVDNLHDSASLLNIDLSDLDNIAISPSSNLRLRVDQVQNIAFMVKNAEGILQGVVNSNSHGTGKTVEALASVFFLAQRRKAQHDFDAHKATLVLTSHQALRGWEQIHAQFFSNLLTLYVCTKSSQDLGNSRKIPLSAPELAATLDGMDSCDPKTSCSVILCTYHEFSSNEFLKTRKKDQLVGKKEFSARNSQLVEEAHEALQVGQKPVLFDLNFKKGTLDKIGTLIADEAHEIKDPRTRKAQATYLVDADFNLLITASPADNKISDFRGLLFLLFRSQDWRFNWPWGLEPQEMLDMYSESFDPFEGKDIDKVVPESACPHFVEAMRRGQHLWRLNPHAYRWLGNKMKFNINFSHVVLGAIFRLVVLRRDPNSLVELQDGSKRAIRDIVGIPRTTVKTVELRMRAKQQECFYKLANPWFRQLFDTDRQEKWTPSRVDNINEIPITSFNQTQNARLNYVTADFGLSEVFRLPGNSSEDPGIPDPNVVLDAAKDAGMTFYYKMTRRSTDPSQPPADRVSMIRHLIRRSPKLQWLLVTLDGMKQRKEKVVIFCRHPRTQWLIEGVCAMAEFNFYSLNNTHQKDNVRPKVIADFNKPSKSVDFLLSTMELLGHGYDLSQDCHRMIIFELPNSIPQLLSAIGRIQRVGQTREQQVDILTLAGSYDDYTLHRQYRKFATELWAAGIFHGCLTLLPRSKLPILAAGELIRRQLGSRVNRSVAIWDRSVFRINGKIIWKYNNIYLEDFAAREFRKDTLLGKSLIDEILASGRPGNAPASSGDEDHAGGSGDPEEETEPHASDYQDGEASVMDEDQPQGPGEQDDAESAIDVDVDTDVDVEAGDNNSGNNQSAEEEL
ncbi:hypothetical protein LA080_002713 [Diaporthe eres]|uniref:Helicase C-terminal domain-containing protein n=1 Tax=Diaporthe vaccinii TaxID=105482 RepID=A0ABR4FAJ6_9PEZI|nr:hypothetical protein LA080_002713 [Diaporthe eres]